MLGQRQQQQVEERQRHAHQGVLDRVHRQTLEHLEEKEAGKGQGDKQQRIFDRPIALEVLVYRVDEVHPKAAVAEVFTALPVQAVLQGLFEVGGEECRLPIGAEALVGHLTLSRQEVADKARVRPVGRQCYLAGLAHRHYLQLLGALQAQVEGELQHGGLLAVLRRQRHMHALAQPVDLGAWRELQPLVTQLQFQRVFNTPNITDAHRQKRWFKAVVGEVFGDPQLRRQVETPADTVVGVEQPRLIDAP